MILKENIVIRVVFLYIVYIFLYAVYLYFKLYIYIYIYIYIYNKENAITISGIDGFDALDE